MWSDNGVGNNIRRDFNKYREVTLVANALKVTVQHFATISPGDMYLAIRNTDVKLLQCEKVQNGIVYPTTPDYPFDIGDCVRVQA